MRLSKLCQMLLVVQRLWYLVPLGLCARFRTGDSPQSHVQGNATKKVDNSLMKRTLVFILFSHFAKLCFWAFTLQFSSSTMTPFSGVASLRELLLQTENILTSFHLLVQGTRAPILGSLHDQTRSVVTCCAGSRIQLQYLILRGI